MYATQQDLVERFGQEEIEAHAWDLDLDQADTARIDRALQDATDLVDLYIAAVATLPISPAPPILVALTADIARYKLQDDNPLDEASERYKAAVATLKDIAAGRATLVPEAPAAGSGRVWAARDLDDRLMTNETLSDFM